MDLTNYAVNRHANPPPINIPADAINRIKAYHSNVSEEVVIEGLEILGADTICDLISQGYLLFDVSVALDLPLTILDRWLQTNHAATYQNARRLSAQPKVAEARQLLMNVKVGDRDAMAIAKVQANHLKWEAARDDPEQYGDKVKHNVESQPVVFNIALSGGERINMGNHVIDHGEK